MPVPWVILTVKIRPCDFYIAHSIWLSLVHLIYSNRSRKYSSKNSTRKPKEWYIYFFLNNFSQTANQHEDWHCKHRLFYPKIMHVHRNKTSNAPMDIEERTSPSSKLMVQWIFIWTNLFSKVSLFVNSLLEIEFCWDCWIILQGDCFSVYSHRLGFPGGLVAKIHLPMQEIQVWYLDQKDPLE